MYYYTNGMRFRHKELCQKIIPRLLRRRRETIKKIRPADKQKSHYLHTYKLEIEGMTCSNCSTRIENAFNTREAVTPAQIQENEQPHYTPNTPLQNRKPVKS